MKKKISVLSLALLLSLTVFSQDVFKAVQTNDLAGVKYLLNKGIDVNTKNTDGETPLMLVVKRNNVRLANLLLEKDADINIRDVAGNTALIQATMTNAKEVLSLLLTRHANINIQNNAGATALMVAVKAGNTGQVRLLMRYGASVIMKDFQQKSAFDYAKNNGEINMLLSGAIRTGSHFTEE